MFYLYICKYVYIANVWYCPCMVLCMVLSLYYFWHPSSQQSGNSIALKIAQDYADPVYQQSQQPVQAAPPPPSIFPITNMATPAPAPNVLTDDQINRKFEDLTAIACLLCKRKFPSIDNLKRHQELSDLHKVYLLL